MFSRLPAGEIADKRAIEHLLVERDVLARAGLVVEAVERLVHDAGDLGLAHLGGAMPERHRLIHRPEEEKKIEWI